jgi:uncharacterized membrane protein
MDFFYPFHPRTVHFPIALSLVGAFFILLGAALATRKDDGGSERWLQFGRMSLVLGWIGVLVAVITGLVDQSRAPDDPVVTQTINLHITVGVALLVVLGLAVYWPLKNKRVWTERRWAYLALIAVAAGLVLVESWLGGKLVYQLGVGVGPIP